MKDLRRWITSRMSPDATWARALVRLYGSRRGVGVRFERDAIAITKKRCEIRISTTKFPYVQDMILHFDAYYGTVEPDERGIVDYSVPKVHRLRKNGISFHLPSIAEEIEAIDDYFRWYKPQPGDLVFDLGAHAGVSTYFLSQAVGPTGRVIAFEPDPLAWASLTRNIEHLKMGNVQAIQKAVAGQRGRLAFQAEGSLGSALASVSSRPGGGSVLVDAITFSDACEIAGGAPRFVKMDIEGAELEVIAAAQDYLKGKQIDFAADTNHTVGGALTSTRLENLFRQAGYRSESSNETGFLTTWANHNS
jgi:FkbM family methyltransferase